MVSWQETVGDIDLLNGFIIKDPVLRELNSDVLPDLQELFLQLIVMQEDNVWIQEVGQDSSENVNANEANLRRKLLQELSPLANDLHELAVTWLEGVDGHLFPLEKKKRLEEYKSIRDEIIRAIDTLLVKMNTLRHSFEMKNFRVGIVPDEVLALITNPEIKSIHIKHFLLGLHQMKAAEKISIIFHDLYNSLNEVRSYAEVACLNESKGHSDKARSFIELVTIRMRSFAKKVSLDRAETVFATEVVTIADEVVRSYHRAAKNKGINIKLLSPQQRLHLLIHEAEWRNILENLLTNAIKYTEDGSITVSLYEENDQVVLEVSDTGLGMTKQQISMIQGQHSHRSHLDQPGWGVGWISINDTLHRYRAAAEIHSIPAYDESLLATGEELDDSVKNPNHGTSVRMFFHTYESLIAAV